MIYIEEQIVCLIQLLYCQSHLESGTDPHDVPESWLL